MSLELIPSAVCALLGVVTIIAYRSPGRWLDGLCSAFGIGGIDARGSAFFFFIIAGATYAVAIFLLREMTRFSSVGRIIDASAAALILALASLWLISRLGGRGSGLGD